MRTTKTMKTKAMWLCGIVLTLTGMAWAAVNVKGALVDATVGYTVGGLAPSGYAICGDGSKGTYSNSCPIAAATAVALAATPAQCSGSTPIATGVQANGNANCTAASGTTTMTSVSKSLGVVYQNTTGYTVEEFVTGQLTGSYGQDFQIVGSVGSTAGSLAQVSENGVHNSAGRATTILRVPPGSYYEMSLDTSNLTNPVTPTVVAWFEYVN